MARVRTAAVLAVLACLLAVPAIASASPVTTMVAKINAYREQHGLRALRISGSLMHSASAYSSYMMGAGYFGHLPKIQASNKFRTLGEIIEWHRGTHPADRLTFNDWINSGEHRAIILYPNFRYIGGGFTEGRFRGMRSTIWCMHFGS